MGMNPIVALQAALGILTAIFIAGWSAAVAKVRTSAAEPSPATDAGTPTPTQVGIGAVTNFFDTLGIGSFATTTAFFRFLKIIPDRVIPGTLNVGHTLPTIAQALKIRPWTIKIDDGGNMGQPNEPDFNDIVLTAQATVVP